MTISILFVVVLVVFLISGIHGWRKGLLGLLFSLIAVVLLLFLVSHTTPYVTEFLKNHTMIYDHLQQNCVAVVQNQMESGLESATGGGTTGLALPAVLSAALLGGGESLLEDAGIYEAVGTQLADWIFSAVAFLVSFVAMLIVVIIIGHVLDLANRIPVLKGINRGLGTVAGLFLGYIIVCLIMLVISMTVGVSGAEGTIMTNIEGNVFLKALYDHNLILEFLSLWQGGN